MIFWWWTRRQDPGDDWSIVLAR